MVVVQRKYVEYNKKSRQSAGFFISLPLHLKFVLCPPMALYKLMFAGAPREFFIDIWDLYANMVLPAGWGVAV